MATGAAGLQGCGPLLAAAGEVLSPDKLSAGSGSRWMGGAEKPPETNRRAVYELPSCKESVFGKMLANEATLLCARHVQYNVVQMTKCTSMLSYHTIDTPV